MLKIREMGELLLSGDVFRLDNNQKESVHAVVLPEDSEGNPIIPPCIVHYDDAHVIVTDLMYGSGSWALLGTCRGEAVAIHEPSRATVV